MNNRILIVAAVVVIIIVASVFVLVNKPKSADKSAVQNETNTQQNTNNSNSQTNTETKMVEVNLTSNGYEPSEIKIKAGTTVVWANKSGKEATVNSDPHPTHFLWPFLNLGNFADGQNLSVMFEKAGVYTYHDHFDPNHKGTVTVE